MRAHGVSMVLAIVVGLVLTALVQANVDVPASRAPTGGVLLAPGGLLASLALWRLRRRPSPASASDS